MIQPFHILHEMLGPLNDRVAIAPIDGNNELTMTFIPEVRQGNLVIGKRCLKCSSETDHQIYLLSQKLANSTNEREKSGICSSLDQIKGFLWASSQGYTFNNEQKLTRMFQKIVNSFYLTEFPLQQNNGNLNDLDLTEVFELGKNLQARQKVLRQIRDVDCPVLMFIGATKTGKSTMINRFMSCRLEYVNPIDLGVQSPNPQVIAAIDPVAKIGFNLLNSQTLHTKIYQKEGKDFVVCDSPGFGDTRGEMISLCNLISIVEMLKAAPSIQGFCVFYDFGELQGSTLKLILVDHFLMRIFLLLGHQYTNFMDNLIFVLSKVKQADKATAIERFKKLLEEVLGMVKDKTPFSKFCDALFTHLNNPQSIIIADPMEEGAHFEEVIGALKPVVPQGAFGYPIEGEKIQVLLLRSQENCKRSCRMHLAELWQMAATFLEPIKGEINDVSLIRECVRKINENPDSLPQLLCQIHLSIMLFIHLNWENIPNYNDEDNNNRIQTENLLFRVLALVNGINGCGTKQETLHLYQEIEGAFQELLPALVLFETWQNRIHDLPIKSRQQERFLISIQNHRDLMTKLSELQQCLFFWAKMEEIDPSPNFNSLSHPDCLENQLALTKEILVERLAELTCKKIELGLVESLATYEMRSQLEEIKRVIGIASATELDQVNSQQFGVKLVALCRHIQLNLNFVDSEDELEKVVGNPARLGRLKLLLKNYVVEPFEIITTPPTEYWKYKVINVTARSHAVCLSEALKACQDRLLNPTDGNRYNELTISVPVQERKASKIYLDTNVLGGRVHEYQAMILHIHAREWIVVRECKINLTYLPFRHGGIGGSGTLKGNWNGEENNDRDIVLQVADEQQTIPTYQWSYQQ
jgi:hypothetical protein